MYQNSENIFWILIWDNKKNWGRLWEIFTTGLRQETVCQ